MSVFASLKTQAKQLKQQTLTVYFAARDPRTPFLVRALAVLVAAYALSPIDLIPDFIPIIGYLDDLLLVPLGLALVVRLTPPEVLESARAQAQQAASRPVSYGAAAFIVALWVVASWVFHAIHTKHRVYGLPQKAFEGSSVKGRAGRSIQTVKLEVIFPRWEKSRIKRRYITKECESCKISARRDRWRIG